MWGITLNSIVLKCTLCSLEFWRKGSAQWPADAHDWPYLGVSPDQGPDGVCCLNFLRYEAKLNLEAFYDPSHYVWRSQEAAMKGVALMSFAYLMVVVYNLFHGPYDSGNRYHQARQATQEWPPSSS